MKDFLKEPLLHFVLLGALMFIGYYSVNASSVDADSKEITITDHDINRLIANFNQSWNKNPDTATLKKLVEEEIKTEIFYQEARNMGLDQNDEIIRRRLKQKYEFLLQDINVHIEESDETLKIYYDENIHQYSRSKSYTFRQFYFNPDKRTDAKSAAFGAIPKTTNYIDLKADNFHLAQNQNNLTAREMRRLFGNNFTESLIGQVDIGWQAPIQSGFGWHLVYIDQVENSAPKPFEQIKDEVLSDYKAAKSKDANLRWYQELKKTYQIQYDLKDWENILSID